MRLFSNAYLRKVNGDRPPQKSEVLEALNEVKVHKEWSCFRRKASLDQIKGSISLMEESTTKSKLLHLVGRELSCIESRVSAVQEKLYRCNQTVNEFLKIKYDVLHTHLVLDSLYESRFTKQGLRQNLVIAFFKNLLEKFPPEMSAGKDSKWTCRDILCLIEDAFQYASLIDYEFSDSLDFDRNLSVLNSLINDRLEEIEMDCEYKPPFLLLPVRSVDHAMVFLISYCKRKNFSITVFDTRFCNGEKEVRYSKYKGFLREELHFLPTFALTRTKTVSDYLKMFEMMLPATVQEKVTWKGYRSQNGIGSCSSKSMMIALREILSDRFYKELKVAMTLELQTKIDKPYEYEYGMRILEKRLLKAKIAEVRDATKKLRSEKDNPLFRENLESLLLAVGIRKSSTKHNIFTAARLVTRRLEHKLK